MALTQFRAAVSAVVAPPALLVRGPVHSGKTTRLGHWAARQSAASGIPVWGVLAPIREGERQFQLLGQTNQEIHSMTATGGEEVISIGPHRFSSNAFATAREHLLKAVAPHSTNGDVGRIVRGSRAGGPMWVIVDEVGPLELRQDGLEPAVSRLVQSALDRASLIRLVLVVRDSLVDQVLDRYRLTDCAGILELP